MFKYRSIKQTVTILSVPVKVSLVGGTNLFYNTEGQTCSDAKRLVSTVFDHTILSGYTF